MSTFYGTLTGNKGTATRCGTKDSGIRASVQSWKGSVITALNYDGDDLMVQVSWADDSRATMGRHLFYGTLAEFVEKLGGETYG